jgi:hypothetical protein
VVAGGGELSTAVVTGASGWAFSAGSGAVGDPGLLAVGAAGFEAVVAAAGGAEPDAGWVAVGASTEDAGAGVGEATGGGAGAAAVGVGATVVGVAAAAVVAAAVVVAAGSGGYPGTVIANVVIGDANVNVIGSIVTGEENVGSGVAPPAVSTMSCETQNPAAAQDANPAHATANPTRRTNPISASLSLPNAGCRRPRQVTGLLYSSIDDTVRSVVVEDSRYPRCREGVPQTNSPCRRPIPFRIARSSR